MNRRVFPSPTESAPSSPYHHWVFAGPRGPILAVGLEPLLGELGIFLSSWPYHPVATPAPRPADVVVEVNERGFRIQSQTTQAQEANLDKPIDAAVAVMGGLIGACLAQTDGAVCVHAGAVELERGLALLIGGGNAGKSSVALQLAAKGRRLFGDDRIILRAACGGKLVVATCLGLVPKARLPLPKTCGPRYRDFIEARTFVRDGECALLRLEEPLAAGFGDTQEVAAFIVLDRQPSGPAALTPASRTSALKGLLQSASSPSLSVERIVEDMSELTRAVPCYALRFSSSAAAAALVEKELCAARPEKGGKNGRASSRATRTKLSMRKNRRSGKTARH